MFDLRLRDIAAWIREGGYKTVALQMPEGLKARATDIVDFLMSNTGAAFVISGDSCYGACDIFHNFRDVADALVHFGHSPILGLCSEKDVLYVEALCHVDVRGSLKKHIAKFPEKTGLLVTLQYLECLEQAKEVFKEYGKEAIVEKGDKRICYPGQILGCNCSAAESVSQKVDTFVYIGGGNFHPLAVALRTNKRVLALDPVTGDLRNIAETRDRILRKRFAVIQNAKNAEKFLVIVCSKVGQRRSAVAEDIIGKIRKAKKKAYMMYINEVSPHGLAAYHVDAFVSTACPRVAVDDCSMYSKPILTPVEAEIALGFREWDDYTFDIIEP